MKETDGAMGKPVRVPDSPPEDRFAVLFHRNPALMALSTVPDRRFADVNDAFLRALGYQRSEIVGRTAAEIGLFAQPAQSALAAQKLREGGRVADIEMQVRRKDGTILDGLFYGETIDFQGRPYFLTVMIDVTERRRAEEELRESEGRFRLLIKLSPIPIAVTDMAGRFEDLNDRFMQVFGYGPADLNDLEDWWRLAYPDPSDRASAMVDWRKARDRGVWDGLDAENPKYRVTCRDGTDLTVLIKAAGIGMRILYMFIDVTERERSEEALRQSEERHRTVLQTAMDGFWIVDMEGRLLDVNDAYCRMSGYSARELLTMRVQDLEAAESAADVAAHMRLVTERGEHRFETMHRRKDGSVYHVESSVQFRPAEGGRLVAFLRDIGGRKRAEEDHARLEAQLQQAQKMESVGRLAGGVAHDFNNMLAVILGHSEIAMQEADPASPVHADLREIRAAAQRSADLTRQLLAFARRQTVTPKALDLNAAVSGTLNMLRRLIGEDVELLWTPGEGLWAVWLDPSQLDQILANLCINSRDAIAGVGRISISTGNRTLDDGYCADHAGCAPGEYVSIAVTDDGCGMSRETQAHLFEPFFTTKEVGKGTGLGLATVYGAVKQNNGHIHVESEAGRGTTFTIHLPRHAGQAGPAQTEGAAEPDRRGHETILLVEDERSVLELARQMLTRQGYRVLAASTPGEAIRLAREHAGEIHLLMTDVVMPEMNGRDLAKRLLSLHPALKRLFASGYTADVITHHGVLEEGVPFIQKPFTQAELAAKVREALDGEG